MSIIKFHKKFRNFSVS